MNSPTLTPMAWLVACQYLLYAGGWAMAGTFLRQNRSAAWHWGAFMLLLGTAFLLSTARGEPRTFWPYAGSNILFILAFVALRRGLEAFNRAPHRDVEHAVLAACAVVALVALGSSHENAAWRVMVSYGGIAIVMVRAVLETRPHLVQEFGPRVALAQSLPAIVLVPLFSLRVLRQALQPDVPLEFHQAQFGNQAAHFAYLAGAAAFNFSFLSLMVMRLLKHLQHLSSHDALTGLLNRRALEAALRREWQRSRRHGRPMALVALDLDHFKRINDRHGHPVGDAVLAQAAERFRRVARESDLLARTGGEEFLVLMPDTDLQGARRAAERMLAELRQQPIELPRLSLPCTASAGVAQCVAGDPGPEAAFERADQALYRAKQDGRDCVSTRGDGPRATSTLPIGAGEGTA